MLKILFNNNYDSSKLLFSIPVHERQDIINNQIENILNFNPNSKIILHINKSFKNFNNQFTKYHNVYINSKSFNYQHSKGLLWIHVNNYYESIRLNIDYEYFVIISSNEMFIKHGLNKYIMKYKNGLQIVQYSPDINWHNFKKGLDKNNNMINMLCYLNLNTFYGGQTEGQFYQKNIFKNIAAIYVKFFGETEINSFETEEIICQTIFKSFDIDYGLPITLQNYSNKLIFDEIFINNIVNNNITIPHNFINDSLLISPHIDKTCDSIFSIKRVDRTNNKIRDFLSKKGFLLNKELFQLNTYYYSNNSLLFFYCDEHFLFKKFNNEMNEYKSTNFNWFGYEVEEGYYNISFYIKLIKPLNKYDNIGLKITYPFEIIYNFFFEDLIINEWTLVNIPLHISKKQNILFIFDDYTHDLEIEFRKISLTHYDKIYTSAKENILLCLYENIEHDNSKNNYLINYNNIYNMIIEPFFKIYNIFIFNNVNNLNDYKINKLANCYKPNHISINNKFNSINNIFINNIENIEHFTQQNKINIKFVMFFSLDSIFKKNIIDFNFYISKFNFISYYIPYHDNKISNSYNFLSIPYKYILKFKNLLINNIDNKNICYSIYSNLKEDIGKINFNFIFDDNYSKDNRTPLIKYLSDIKDIDNNKGYLLNKKYLYSIYYYNSYSKLLKYKSNEFYFSKKSTNKNIDFQWLGLYIDFFENNIKTEYIKVEFNIKLLKKINNLYSNFGLKTHEPLQYINNWIDSCILNEYSKIELNIQILPKNQFIILNFDNYLDVIEFYIKDFKIII